MPSAIDHIQEKMSLDMIAHDLKYAVLMNKNNNKINESKIMIS